MENFVDEVLRYCADDYNYIVLRDCSPVSGEDKFWTLEKTEEDAKRRVDNETEAYNDPEWQFSYKPLKRTEHNYAHLCKKVIEVTVEW